MNFIALIFTAFALSMDAFAVSITKGMTIKNLKKSTALKMALAFGVFQGAMPLLGWALGISFESYIKSIDHWIAFILLSFIGGKMIFEALKEDDEEKAEVAVSMEVSKNKEREFANMKRKEELSAKNLTVLAIATSIDALAVGVSFAFLGISIVQTIIIIGIITFVLCFLGVIIGEKLGDIFKNYAEIVGGVILILIGINILLEHTGIIEKLFS